MIKIMSSRRLFGMVKGEALECEINDGSTWVYYPKDQSWEEITPSLEKLVASFNLWQQQNGVHNPVDK